MRWRRWIKLIIVVFSEQFIVVFIEFVVFFIEQFIQWYLYSIVD